LAINNTEKRPREYTPTSGKEGDRGAGKANPRLAKKNQFQYALHFPRGRRGGGKGTMYVFVPRQGRRGKGDPRRRWMARFDRNKERRSAEKSEIPICEGREIGLLSPRQGEERILHFARKERETKGGTRERL